MLATRTKLYSICQRILELNLSSDPTENDVDRCAILELTSKSRTESQFNDCGNSSEYINIVKYFKVLKHLREALKFIRERYVAMKNFRRRDIYRKIYWNKES